VKENNNFLDTKEAAAFLGVAVVTLRTWIKQGKIKPFTTGWKQWFDIDTLLILRRRITHRKVAVLK